MIVPYPGLPSARDRELATRRSKIQTQISNRVEKAQKIWAALHMSYRGGSYSIERMIALEEYVRKTSVSRVVLVCVAAPGTLAIFILGLESIPLQEPTAGWSANYGYWIRVAIASMVVANGFLVQIKNFVGGCVISSRQLYLIVVFASIFETPLAIAVSACTWFPLPFSIITMAPSFYPILLLLFWIIIPREVVREMLRHTDQIVRYLQFTAALQLMAVVYPVYQVCFHAVNDTAYELPVLLLLPVIKLVVKNIILRCVTHMEDMMPEAVIFTVDFFNALYMSTSMESATSTSTVVIVVLIDVIQSAIVLYRLNKRTNHILVELQSVAGGGEDLLSATAQLCRDTVEFSKQNLRKIRIRSCLPHCVSPGRQELLQKLEVISRIDTWDSRRHTSPVHAVLVNRHVSVRPRKLSRAATWAERRRMTIVTPAGTSVATKYTSGQMRQQEEQLRARRRANVLREALEVLFTTECLLLSASIDAFVPLFYAIFLLVMVRLPSAKYHTELAGVTTENIASMVDTILSFSLVEFVAFGLLATLIYRNLKMPALYQVAFVLETQHELIRAKLLTWVLMTMAFRVVHFGIDFSFQFVWIAE